MGEKDDELIFGQTETAAKAIASQQAVGYSGVKFHTEVWTKDICL